MRPYILRYFFICLLIILVPLNTVFAVPRMSDYCYLPPFITDPHSPPNLMIAFEKSAEITGRAFGPTYSPAHEYYGFFEQTAHYTYDPNGDFFIKASCSPATSVNCFSGNLLNWALMSSLDLMRKALVGFGWPLSGDGDTAGEVFTYTGNFHDNRAPLSLGQWAEGQSTHVSTRISAGSAEVSYTFCISRAAGSNATGVNIRSHTGQSFPSCSGECTGTCSSPVSGGRVAMHFTDEDRRGTIQRFIDRDSDCSYDENAPLHIGIRRWHRGKDRQTDIIRHMASVPADRTNAFRSILTALSSAPQEDPESPDLALMMKDIAGYFRGASSLFQDNDNWTQTPYRWDTDPAGACRKNFALFLTSGSLPGQSSERLSPLPSSCPAASPDGNGIDAFQANTCYAFRTDLSQEPGFQNISTYVLHSTFYGKGSAAADNLRFASKLGGGEYIRADKPSDIGKGIEEVFLNIFAPATVSPSSTASRTSQTGEASTLLQSSFSPKIENTRMKWIGSSRQFWSDKSGNIREDTHNHGILDLVKDDILSFSYDPDSDASHARTYTDRDGDTIIDSCSGTETPVDSITPVWDAQKLLQQRTPDENADPEAGNPADRKRIILTALGDIHGIVSTGSLFSDFETSLASTLAPFWNYGGYCRTNSSCKCANDQDCNLCSAHPSERACTSGQDNECFFCTENPELSCHTIGSSAECLIDYGTCLSSHRFCTNNPSASCSLEDSCFPYADCAGGSCTYNPDMSCLNDSDCSGSCSSTCSRNSERFCSDDTDCRDSYGTCAYDRCMEAAAGTCIEECDSACAESVIKYVRGFDNPSPSGEQFRIRHSCTQSSDCPSGTCENGACSSDARDIMNTLKLADIVFSSPTISPDSQLSGYTVRYHDESYTKFIERLIKPGVSLVIVGANDGMVHAFKHGKLRDIQPPSASGGGKQVAMLAETPDSTVPARDLGHEMWSFIPYNVIPYLRWFSKESYCHIPMLDARFTVLDASIGGEPESTKTVSSWRRLLIGTMGIGGNKITVGPRTWSSSVFVIDITDPANPVLKWERPLPDNTLTTSTPAVVRLGLENSNGSWYVVMGSGPDTAHTHTLHYKTSQAGIFIFNLRDGSVIQKKVPGSSLAVGDILSADLDGDYQVDALYFGTYGMSGTSPAGTFFRLRTRSGNEYLAPSEWSLEPVVDLGRPVFAAPEIAQDDTGTIWIYFGTGLYLSMNDTVPVNDSEYLFGYIEPGRCWTNGCSGQELRFYDVTDISFSGARATETGCMCAGQITSSGRCASPGNCNNISCGSGESAVILGVEHAILSSGPEHCNGKAAEGAIQCLSDYIFTNYQGWKRRLTGEKLFSKPLVAGGLVTYTSFQPFESPCGSGGITLLGSVHYTSGTPYIQPVFHIPEGTSGPLDSLTLLPVISLGAGVPMIGESLTLLPMSGEMFRIITQVNGGISVTVLHPSVPPHQGYSLWISR